MSLIPFEPLRHLENMRREFDRFFGQHSFAVPSIDIHETDNEIVATCEIPGLDKKEDVDIRVDHHVLTVNGTVNRTHEVRDENMRRSEQFIGGFQRSVALPVEVQHEGIKASYKNGVLEIRMPKIKTAGKKKIDIEFY